MPRWRAVIYSSAGVPIAPLMTIFDASYEYALDRIGSYQVTIPASDRREQHATAGNRIWLYREGEGLVFRGTIDETVTAIDTDGRAVKIIRGSSIARELVWRKTGAGLEFEGVTVATAVNTLLNGTGYTAGSIASPANLYAGARHEWDTRWSALGRLAQTFGLHVRDNCIDAELDVNSLGTSSGIRLQGFAQIPRTLADNVYPISEISVEEDARGLINRAIPLGAGEGVNKLTLQYSNRSSPFTIQTDTGPDGQTFHYIEDSGSVSTYELREKALAVKEATPNANTTTAFQNAANALYDVSATWLQRHKDPVKRYSVRAVGLKHIVNSNQALKVGDKLHVTYRGFISDTDGDRVWLDVDEELWLLGFSRSSSGEGDNWQLDVSNVDLAEEDVIADTVSDVYTLQVGLKNYTFRDSYILQRISIDTGQPATLRIDWDENLGLVHKVALTFQVTRLRSNVSTVADDGATSPTTTNDGSTIPTTSSGGGQTSTGGTSHSHEVSGQTAQSGGGTTESSTSEGDHRHRMFENVVADGPFSHDTSTAANDSMLHKHVENLDATYTQNAISGFVAAADNNMDHDHFISIYRSHGRFATDATGTSTDLAIFWQPLNSPFNKDMWTRDAGGSHSHSVTIPNHTHTVSGTTSATESAHTHNIADHDHTVSIPDHNHSVSIPAHNHALQYGINLGPTVSNPGVTVTINGTDRTTALGGPWNTVGSDVTLDITQYLQGTGEQPLRQSNTIEFGATTLADIEAIARADLTRSALVPV